MIAGDVIRNFIEGYNPEGRSEEGVTEFIAMLAAGEIDVQIEKGILRKMAEVMGSVLPFNVSIPSRTQGVQIMKDIADSMRDGAPVDPDKIQKAKARKDKGQEAGDKAQAIEAVDNEDGSVMSTINRENISETAGKEQIITAEAPQYTLNEIFEKTEGRVIVITSDNTGIGNVDGKDVMGGIGYSFLQENLRDGVGFASVNQESVGKVKNMVEKIGKGKDVAVLIMQQNPTAMLGNFYAADYLSEAILKSFPKNRKKVAEEMSKYLLGLTPISNPKKTVKDPSDPKGKKTMLVPDPETAAENKRMIEAFAKGITSEGTKAEAIAEILDNMSFPLRNKIVSSLLPTGYGADSKIFEKGLKGIKPFKPTKSTNYVTRGLANAGFSQVDFWKKYSSPEANTDEYITNAVNGDWGYTYTGFITNSTLDWGKEFQKKGVTHPQFNAKLPSKETFKLDGGYQVDEAFKDVLTYGYNKDKKEYTKPPAGLSKSTSQSIFAGSFQQSTQEAVLELVAQPNTDPFNQYAMLASTQEGKAQIIGELGASKSHKMINKLELARDMEGAGKDKEAIFLATGWYRGLDNQWRSEIRYGHIRKSFFDNIASLGKSGAKDVEFNLADMLDSPVLYEMYPNIKNDYVFVIENMSYLGYHQRSHTKKDKTEGSKIAVSAAAFFEEVNGEYRVKKNRFKELMDTVYHEVQHAVQSAEGVSDGYNELRVQNDVWYSKKRNLNTAKAQLKTVNLLLQEMMEIGEEQMIKNHRTLSYFGEALTMDGRAEDAKNNLGSSNATSNFRWIDSVDPRLIEDLSKLYGKEITEENFPNELLDAILDSRPQGRSIAGDVTAFDVIKRDNFSSAESALEAFGYAVEAAKYFMDNGGIEALKHEKKIRSASNKHFNFFDYAFRNTNVDSGDPTWNFRNRVDYLNRIGKGAAVNISRYGEKTFFGKKMKKFNFDVYLENLGEAEARLAGKRGTQKLKNRVPLIGALFPNVSETEIWQIPPSAFYMRMNEVKKEVAIEKERLSDLKMDFDTKLTEGLSSLDIDTVEEKIESLETAIKVFGTKLQDAFADKKGKAQLIEGTFEDALFRKETQEQLIREGVDNFFKSDTGVNRLFEHLRFKFADKYRPLQNLQTAIEKEKNRLERTDSNFRRAEALMHGKAAEDARQFEEQQLKPLMDKMVEYGVTNEQISEYLYALHAYERNEFVKNTIDPANEAGSGMTNEVAEEIKKKYAGQKEKMDELAEMSYAIAQASRDMMLEFGLISKAQYDSFNMFENYVPLVGNRCSTYIRPV